VTFGSPKFLSALHPLEGIGQHHYHQLDMWHKINKTYLKLLILWVEKFNESNDLIIYKPEAEESLTGTFAIEVRGFGSGEATGLLT